MTIDGYSHCGLSKYRPVEDVLAIMHGAGVGRAVLCQHLGEYDNQYLLEVVERYPTTFAAACLVDPTSSQASDDLTMWHSKGGFRGVRLLADWIDDHQAVWTQAVKLGLTLVVYASRGAAAAVPSIIRFATTHPDARIVVTHMGNPQLQDGRLVETELLRLAPLPGVFVQLSGLSQFCEYPYLELHQFIRETVRAFGESRIYWGSNFPVCGNESAYVRDLLQVRSETWALTSDQMECITSRTAQRLWFPDA